MEEDKIEEGSSSSARLLRKESSSRWVDGSEVDSSEQSSFGDSESREREGYGSVRRRLVKKPKRVDSFDVEAMEIAGSHGHHNKIMGRTRQRK